jgi:hypothetical protein
VADDIAESLLAHLPLNAPAREAIAPSQPQPQLHGTAIGHQPGPANRPVLPDFEQLRQAHEQCSGWRCSQQFLSADRATIVNGWRYPPPQIGRYGDDFLLRAADQSLAGITCNDHAEGVYLMTFTDAEDRKFEGGSRYELHFDADGMPPADSFWSLALYGSDLNLVANPLDHYSIGDRTAGLEKDSDGGLTIYL